MVEKIIERTAAEQNELIKSTARMNVTPLKLFSIAISAIDGQSDHPAREVSIKKTAIYEALEIGGANRNQRLTQALRQLVNQAVFESHVKNERGQWQDVIIKPIYKAVNDYGSEYCQVIFTAEIMPLVSRLSRDFTRYQLRSIMRMRSRYSIALYKLIVMHTNQYNYYQHDKSRSQQWLNDQKNPTFSMDELRVTTGTTTKYKDYRNFKHRVLEPAVAEINDLSTLQITAAPVKAGQKVVGIKFSTTFDNQSAVNKEPAGSGSAQEPSNASVVANPYAGLLIASQLLDPVKVMTEEEYRDAIANRLFPAYDQFVKAHSRDLLERHIKYVGNHTTGTPAHLVPYLLEALSKYEKQLRQAAATPPSPQKKPHQRKVKVTEKLPKWAEQTDVNERTEGPASEAQIQDSMQALANLRKQQQERRQHEQGTQQ